MNTTTTITTIITIITIIIMVIIIQRCSTAFVYMSMHASSGALPLLYTSACMHPAVLYRSHINRHACMHPAARARSCLCPRGPIPHHVSQHAGKPQNDKSALGVGSNSCCMARGIFGECPCRRAGCLDLFAEDAVRRSGLLPLLYRALVYPPHLVPQRRHA